eukprot:10535276-Heterocapsa_arctica.AAC.1
MRIANVSTRHWHRQSPMTMPNLAQSSADTGSAMVSMTTPLSSRTAPYPQGDASVVMCSASGLNFSPAM